MRKAFTSRLSPTATQEQALSEMLEPHRRLYHQALAERKTAWEQEPRSVTSGQQSAPVKDERPTHASLARTNYSSWQATVRRLERAVQAVFRRVQAGEPPGYPRCTGRNRFATVAFPSYGDGCPWDSEAARVYFPHIGLLKVKLHRPVAGPLKTISFTRAADGWHVVCSCQLPDAAVAASPLPATGRDLGLKVFLVTADGREIAPPRSSRKAQAALRRSQRAVARTPKGSQRRRQAVKLVAKRALHVANQRRNFHHQTAYHLTRQYGLIAHEARNIQGLARSRLAKSTHDVGWGHFLSILHRKADGAGVWVIAVPPANTTQQGSACGALPQTPEQRTRLGDRVPRGPSCGSVADRDRNAAQHILRLGRSLQASPWPAGASVA